MEPTGDLKKAVYQELCDSYRAIDDFRMKLLGLLPMATAAAFLILLNPLSGVRKDEQSGLTIGAIPLGQVLTPIGIFGFVVTLGLFLYEIHGIRKCHHLIARGQDIEQRLLAIPGQFLDRPRAVAGVINEPISAGIIYSAVLAAWAYVALIFLLAPSSALAAGGAGCVFLAGFSGTVLYDRWLRHLEPKPASLPWLRDAEQMEIADQSPGQIPEVGFQVVK
jgi:hypothetical protein